MGSNPEKWHKAERLITETLTAINSGLSEFERDSVMKLLYYNEHNIAAGMLIEQIAEHQIPINDSVRERLTDIIRLLEMDKERYQRVVLMIPRHS